MQIPRGTFRSIKKGVYLGEILDDSSSSRFTGTCTFSSGSINGTLVFNAGICVLAKVQDQYGKEGWKEAHTLADRVVDVALSDLNATQIQLALEFNGKAKTGYKEGRLADRSEKIGAGLHRYDGREKDFIKTTPVPSGASVQTVPLDQDPAPVYVELEGVPIKKEPGIPIEPDPTAANDELDVFEEMDFDDVAQKMRKDSKTILKKLQLDHLTKK